VANEFFQAKAVSRAVLAEVQNANLLVCDTTGRNGSVFYYLGLAHALGKRVLTVSAERADIPFEAPTFLSLTYSPSQANWNDRLAEDLTNALRQLEASPGKPENAPESHGTKRSFIRWALSNEIKFNLSEIERIGAKNLVFLGVWHPVDRKSFPIVRCETEAFESEEVQLALEKLAPQFRDSVKGLYRSFYTMNEKAENAEAEISLKNAQEYLKAVREFESGLGEDARRLLERLAGKWL
jgi:hypothetical protein